MAKCAKCEAYIGIDFNRIGGQKFCYDCVPPMHLNSRQVVNDDEIYNGFYEHLSWDGVNITGGKKQLIAECKKRGVMAKALVKPKSRGKGYEMRGEHHVLTSKR